MKLSEALVAARALIEKPESWIQGAPAQDREGSLVEPTAYNACKFCSIGALTCIALGPAYKHRMYTDMYNLLLAHTGEYNGVVDFNDNSTHTEVLELFDKAIETAEKWETHHESL